MRPKPPDAGDRALTVALEMMGPMPGTLINQTAASSACASSSISAETASMRASSCRQSLAWF
jgi:hypothetical protein